MMKAKFLLAALALSAMAVSCTLDKLEEPVQDGKQLVVLTATAAQSGTGTKTTLVDNGPDIYWSPGDQIMAFQPSWGAGSYSYFGSNLSAPARTAEFSGWASVSAGHNAGNNEIWALYPIPDGYTPYFDGASVKTKHPQFQTAQIGTFDPKSLITLARSNTNQLSFYNVCGGLKFKVSSGEFGDDESIKYVEFRSNDGTPLSGTATLRFDGDGKPVVYNIDDGSSSVILTAPDGEYFVPGEWYYLTCLPAVLEQGFTLTFRRGNDFAASYVRTEPAEIKRSVWGVLENPDEGLTWELSDTPRYNEIWYWTSDEDIIEIPEWCYDSWYWGANLISNTSNGLNGCCLTFDGPVTKISNVGLGSEQLTDIMLPSTVKSIEGWAFSGATNLVYAGLPEGLEEIGECAFQSCYSLEEFNVPSGIQRIGPGAFSYCYRLTTFIGDRLASADGRCVVRDGDLLAFAPGTPEGRLIDTYVIPEGVTGLADGCFAWTVDLEELTLPSSLLEIGSEVFVGCVNLRKFSGPFASQDGRLLIQDGTIKAAAMAGITELVVPGTVSTVGKRAFYNSWNMESLTISEGVQFIEEEAFAQCSSLKDVTLPSTLTGMGEHVFMGSNAIESFSGKFATEDQHYLVDGDGVLLAVAKATASDWDVLPNTVKVISSYAFENAQGIGFYSLPDSVVEIGENAFANSVLCDIYLPEGLEYIGSSAFHSSDLGELFLPASLTGIGYGIVWNCNSLSEVTVFAETPPDTDWNDPFNNSNLTAIYVPAGSVAAYKAAPGWSIYADIIVAIP